MPGSPPRARGFVAAAGGPGIWHGDAVDGASGDRSADGRPRLDADAITARARAAYGPLGRPALPHTAWWPIFPFETDGLRTRTVEDPVLPEPPRRGEAGGACDTCDRPDDEYVWAGARWRISMPHEPVSLPTLTIFPRAHLDLGDLTEELGAELGALVVRADRALAGIDGVGRVHVYKWGDGGAHLHVVLVARPEGMVQLRGHFLSTWMFVLPPLPADVWADMRTMVGQSLSGSRG